MPSAKRLIAAEDRIDQEDSLRRLPCDSPLHAVRGLEAIKRTSLYPRRSVLFVEGQPPRGVHVLCTGRAKVSITSADGRTLIIRVAGPGALLGLSAALTGAAYEATVETLERCRIDFVPRANLLELFDQQRSVRHGLLLSLSNEFREVMDHTRVVLLSQSAGEKLARLILKWCREAGERTADGIRLRLLLTQEEMAQMIGTSRETVTRLLSALKRKRIVRVRGSALVVQDRVGLESIAQGER